jgi:hypothetical protein
LFSAKYNLADTDKLPVRDHITLQNRLEDIETSYIESIQKYLPGFRKLEDVNTDILITSIFKGDQYPETQQSLFEAIEANGYKCWKVPADVISDLRIIEFK